MHRENGKEYLEYMTSLIRERIRDLGLSIEEGQRDIDQMHEYYWENYTEMDQYGYENFDNQQALFHQITANEDAMKLRRRYRKMLQSPFFGRVDFRYEDEDEAEAPEIFYIGIGNFALEDGQVPLIFDWRAPVSSLFYDFDKGPASYTAPVGEICGDILAKWQYKIRDGRMIYEFESDVKIDDEILKEELGAGGEEKLKAIIRTIQKEQNAIIRNTHDRILVIQGAAGSGKTSIALHRIAYLLYHDRKHLKSSNILILSPNGIFADYISQILPELGEENIREMTLDLYAYRQLKEIAGDCEDRYDQIEEELAGRRGGGALYRHSKAFANRLEGFVIRLEDELMNFHSVEYRGQALSEDTLLELFYFRFSQIPLLSRMEAVADYFVDQVETLLQKDLQDQDRDQLYEEFMGMYETRDVYEIYNRFLAVEGLPLLPDVPVQERKLSYEDMYPVLYLKHRLTKTAPDPSIRHLVVDEMQDYSWIQFAILHQLFSCRMTILGDMAQTMESGQRDARRFLPGILGKEIRILSINKCYRNTMEIATYANDLLGISGMELFERHGAPVTERIFERRDAAVGESTDGNGKSAAVGESTDGNGKSAAVGRDPGGTETFYIALDAFLEQFQAERDHLETAALITLTEADATLASGCLREKLQAAGFDTKNRFLHLHRNSTTFRKGLTVTTFYLAKGLEFDHVWILFPKEADSPLAIQARYIAATRAMHRLDVFLY